MPPPPIFPASTVDGNAEHQREEPDPDRAARPPPPRPPKDIYATLASTLAPMDAEQYYQSIEPDLPEDHATLQGCKQEKRNDNEWGTEEDPLFGKTPGKAPRTPSSKQQPKPTPTRPGTLGTASTPS